MAFRIVNALMALLFVYAAAVQLNDPDPTRWVTVYTLAALVTVVAFTDRIPAAVPASLGLVAVVWAAVVWIGGIERSHLMPGFPQYGVLREELVREGLGLALVAGWMTMLGLRAHRISGVSAVEA